jgi:hypothetical protein
MPCNKYVVGATVRQYHHTSKYDDAVITHVSDHGGLGVEINGEKYGWSTNVCEVISPPKDTNKGESYAM